MATLPDRERRCAKDLVVGDSVVGYGVVREVTATKADGRVRARFTSNSIISFVPNWQVMVRLDDDNPEV